MITKNEWNGPMSFWIRKWGFKTRLSDVLYDYQHQCNHLKSRSDVISM